MGNVAVSADLGAIVSMLRSMSAALPILVKVCAFLGDSVTITDRIVIRKILTATVNVSAKGGWLVCDLSMPDLFGVVRHATINKIVSMAAQYPALKQCGVSIIRGSDGNLWVGVDRITITDASCGGGFLTIEGTLAGGDE